MIGYRLALLGTGIAWLVLEWRAATDKDPRTETLTELLVTFVPWWVTIPAAIVLAEWIVPHFWEAYHKRRQPTT